VICSVQADPTRCGASSKYILATGLTTYFVNGEMWTVGRDGKKQRKKEEKGRKVRE